MWNQKGEIYFRFSKEEGRFYSFLSKSPRPQYIKEVGGSLFVRADGHNSKGKKGKRVGLLQLG